MRASDLDFPSEEEVGDDANGLAANFFSGNGGDELIERGLEGLGGFLQTLEEERVGHQGQRKIHINFLLPHFTYMPSKRGYKALNSSRCCYGFVVYVLLLTWLF